MPGRPPSLRTIAAFEAAARHQSFSKAANELNLTHGAISHAIKALEERLGHSLFERTGRGVNLTEQGRVLAGKVRLSIGLLSDAFEARPWVQDSKLVVSVLPSFGTSFLAPRLGRFRERHPSIRLEFRASWSLAQIGGGEVDVGLRYGPGGWAGLSAERLTDETFFPVVSPAYSRPVPDEPSDLLEHDLIAHTETPWRAWFDAAGIHGERHAPHYSFDDAALALAAAAGGAGIALARSLLVRQYLERGALIKLFELEVPSSYSYWFVWSPVSPKQQVIDTFRSWLAEEFAIDASRSPSGRSNS